MSLYPIQRGEQIFNFCSLCTSSEQLPPVFYKGAGVCAGCGITLPIADQFTIDPTDCNCEQSERLKKRIFLLEMRSKDMFNSDEIVAEAQRWRDHKMLDKKIKIRFIDGGTQTITPEIDVEMFGATVYFHKARKSDGAELPFYIGSAYSMKESAVCSVGGHEHYWTCDQIGKAVDQCRLHIIEKGIKTFQKASGVGIE